MLTATICTIGDEILIGQIVDTNSSMIARNLNSMGIRVRDMISIADDGCQIVSRLSECAESSDIVIVTGGLGPTKDDITKPALCRLSKSDGYRFSREQFAHVERILKARGIPMLDINRDQANVPDRCDVIENELGTAPGMAFNLESNGHFCRLYSLPGVPFEAEGLMDKVCADIRASFRTGKVVHRTIVTFGIAESALARMIEHWENALPPTLKLAYLPNATYGVRLRLSYYADGNEADAEALIDSEFAKIRPVLGDLIYGEGNDNLQTVIGRMLKGKTVCAAESCTGGRISSLMTSVAGCSEYYKGGVTSYANEVKINVLGVPAEIIAEYGAVSRECVEKMASGVRRLMGCDYSVATSGIAGPGGGSVQKPVGTCWMAVCYTDSVSGEEKVESRMVRFASNRAVNIERFASSALDFLRIAILRNSSR